MRVAYASGIRIRTTGKRKRERGNGAG